MTYEEQRKIEEFKADKAHEEELTRLTAQFEHAAMRPAYLLNGGAVIATLTYLGHALEQNKAHSTKCTIITALLFWLAGLVLISFAAWFGYKSQWRFLKAYRQKIDGNVQAKEQFATKGQWHRSWWENLILASLLCFVAGSGFAIWFLASS